jgi:hypothetical protein
MELIFRPSGVPESSLHLIFGEPTGGPRTYSWKRAVIEKGFVSSCFAFDVFSPRTLESSDSIRVSDDIHRRYRRWGGAITLIFGNVAAEAYYRVVEKEGLQLTEYESHETKELCGTVLLERSV